MALTTNLTMTLLEVGQKEKEVTINTALNTIDDNIQKPLVKPLVSGTSMQPDLSYKVNACNPLTTNTTIQVPTNRKIGRETKLIITQDATGSRTVSWAAGGVFKFSGNVTASTAADSVDVFSLYDDGTNIYVIAYKGFV